MFEPQFSLSDALKSRLRSIDEANAYLKRLTFPDATMERLKKEALARTIYLVVHAEDSRVGYGAVARFLAQVRGDGGASAHTIGRVCAAVKKAGSLSETVMRLDEEDFVALRLLLKGEIEGAHRPKGEKGPYRNAPKEVRANAHRRIYTPADHREIPLLMSDLFDWLGYETDEVHPIVKGIVAYFQILIVRPFFDDNCKLAWLLLLSTFALNGLDFGGYVSLEESVFSGQSDFHKDVLHLVATTYDPKNFSRSNFQPYILYLLPFVENTVTDRRLQLDRQHFNEVGGMLRNADLNERQRKALTYVADRGRITNREYRELNGVRTRKRAWQELTHLVDADLLHTVGQGCSVAYIFSPMIGSETILKQLGNI